MSDGNFTDFLDALRQFESGVYGTPSDDLRTEQYASVNSLGFVGYQFGEAVLKDLGYYSADEVYTWGGTNGKTGNTWDGTFTGKDGVYDLSDLKTNVQEGIILDEFGSNMEVINTLLHEGAKKDGLPDHDLSHFIGTTIDGVTVTESGLMAAAHLVGASGVADMLLHPDNVHYDENGTSAIDYMAKFGGYQTPGIDVLEQSHDQHTTHALSEIVWQRDFDGNGQVGDGQHHAGWDHLFSGEASPTVQADHVAPASTPAEAEAPGADVVEAAHHVHHHQAVVDHVA